jgi:hypothetical protein
MTCYVTPVHAQHAMPHNLFANRIKNARSLSNGRRGVGCARTPSFLGAVSQFRRESLASIVQERGRHSLTQQTLAVGAGGTVLGADLGCPVARVLFRVLDGARSDPFDRTGAVCGGGGHHCSPGGAHHRTRMGVDSPEVCVAHIVGYTCSSRY